VKVPLCLSLLGVALVFCSSYSSANALNSAHSTANSSEAAATSPPDGVLANDFTIPGPLRSFLRMAGISQKIAPEEVLPLLSRNVFMQGYEAPEEPNSLFC